MKPIILKQNDKLKLDIEDNVDNWSIYVIVSYAISWDNFSEESVVYSLSDSWEYELLNNSSTDKYVIVEVNVSNFWDNSNIITYLLEDWDWNKYTIWEVSISSKQTIQLSDINQTSTSWDEKVKADSNDNVPWYLFDKVDDETIEVDTATHKLKVKQISSSYISDFTEAAQDAVWAAVWETNTVKLSYDDNWNKIYWDLKYNSTTTINITEDSDWIYPNVLDNTSTQKVVVDLDWTNKWTRKELNFIQWDNVTIDVQDNSTDDRLDITISATWGWSWLSITPVAKYDGSLVEWVFEEIQLPSNITINSIKAVLEWKPSGSDDDNDDTELKIEYTTDWWDTWNEITTINFDADDSTINWVLIKDVSIWNDYDENTRIRFNITKTADNYAGDNLKVYFK